MLIFYLFYEFRERNYCSLGVLYLYIYASNPRYFFRTYFLFLGATCASRDMEAVGRASSQCLVAGPLIVTRTHRKVA